MPLQLTRQGIRLRADERSRQPLLDVYTNATPQGWVKASTQFEVALASGGNLVDVMNLSSVTLSGAPSAAKDGPRAFSRTLAGSELDNTLTETTWSGGGAQHALFIFSASEMNVPLGGANGADFWFVVTALTLAGDEIVCGTGRLLMRDDGAFGDAGGPPGNPGAALSVDQGDARYAPLGVAGLLTSVTSVGDGAAHSLEALPTLGLELPALRTIYLPAADEIQDWLLVGSAHATAAGTIQRPADYDASTNPRVWFRKR